MFHGTPRERPRHSRSHLERGPGPLPLLFLIVFLGVYPKPVLDRIEPSVDVLLVHVEDVTGYEAPEPVTPTITEAAPDEGGDQVGHGDEEGE